MKINLTKLLESPTRIKRERKIATTDGFEIPTIEGTSISRSYAFYLEDGRLIEDTGKEGVT